MPTLQELERPIDEEIAGLLVEATPESWNAIELEVVWRPEEGGIEGYEHTISSPEKHRDIIAATEPLHDATFRLAQLFREHGRQWKRVKYSIRRKPSGDWGYVVKFEY